MTALSIDTTALMMAPPPHLRPTQLTGDKLRKQANDFESMFLSSMMQHMFTAIGKEGPLGNAQGVGVWRSMLTDQYAKSIVKSGGIGIANQVYKSLLARQTVKAA
jgi:peptidoglycan hydrolase FlgJ